MQTPQSYSRIVSFSRSGIFLNSPFAPRITKNMTICSSLLPKNSNNRTGQIFWMTQETHHHPFSSVASSTKKKDTLAKKSSKTAVTNEVSAQPYSLGTINSSDDGIRFDRYMQLSYSVSEEQTSVESTNSNNHPSPTTKNGTLTEIPLPLLQRLARQKNFYVQKKDGTIGTTHITCSSRLGKDDTIVVTNVDVYRLFTPKTNKYSIKSTDSTTTTTISSSNTVQSVPNNKSSTGSTSPPPSSPPSSPTGSIVVLPPCPPWLRTCIKYIDKDVIIISKPTGIASQPGGEESHSTTSTTNGSSSSLASSVSLNTYLPILEQVLNQYNPERHNLSSINSLFYNVLNNPSTLTNNGERLRIVHRLDKDVSGLLIIARSREIAAKLSQHFSFVSTTATTENSTNPSTTTTTTTTPSSTDTTVLTTPKIRKRYFALALSPIPTNKDTLYDELGRIQGVCRIPVTRTEWDTQGNITDQITWSAETQWLGKTILSNAPKVQASPYLSLLSLEPITGRRNQLRQHIFSILQETNGILGDTKYRAKAGAIPSFIFTALSATNNSIPIMLHSYRLSIPAGLLGPHQQRSINVEDELPTHIRTILQLYSVSSGLLSDIIEGNNTSTCTTKRNKGHY